MMRVLLLVLVCCLAVCSLAEQTGAGPVSFEREVQPLLEHRCNRCHHPDESQGGLDLTRMSTILRGGDEHGPAVIAGSPEKSPLIQLLSGRDEPAMPFEADRLPESEIKLLKRWIAEGANDDRPEFSRDDLDFFEKKVRPVLFDRCFKCHAGDDPASGLRLTSRFGILLGGARGAAAVPGKPEHSRLVMAIRHQGELKMPLRGDRLSNRQVASLTEWIRRGLPWPNDQLVLTREKRFTVSQADRNHWAFRPLPTTISSDWSIDRALQRRQQKAGIQPTARADRYRLLRRVYYDLIGYPPTPREIAEFVQNESPQAFEKVVDRLLEAPQFGWRWGRHWLDYTRSGANGQPNRGPSFDSKRYAAWVARCFNEDRSYAWFVRAHIAGDLMPAYQDREGSYSIDQSLAAAVPLNGPRTFQAAGTETFVLMDKLDEGIEFLGRSLMGVSLECSRCHDHKFDPISQRDYYALLGYFQSSWFAPLPRNIRTQAEAEWDLARYHRLVSESAKLNGFIRKQSTELNVGGGGLVRAWRASRATILKPMDRRLRELERAVLKAELARADRDGKTALARDLKTTLADLEERLKDHKPPEYSLGTLKELGYFINGHKTQVGLLTRATGVGLQQVAAELEHQAIYWEAERKRWGERSRFGGYAKTDPEVAELAAADDRIAEISEELAANPAQPWIIRRPTHLIVRTEGGLRRAEDLALLDEKARMAGLQFNSNNPDRVWLHSTFIGNSRLLQRGDVLYPADLIPRDTPVFFGSPARSPRGSGRRQLAEWLTKPKSIQSALVARAAINRIWQHLFGEALCRTPNELGRLGNIPEMPEVIDGLAIRLVTQNWSVKAVIREIVSSDAYQSASTCGDTTFQSDPENRWFARQNLRRLEAEPMMNTAAWQRTERRYTSPDDRNEQLIGAATFLQELDGPTTDDIIHRRVASITATQALFLTNDAAVVNSLIDPLAERLVSGEKNSELNRKEILESLYLQILQRPPIDSDLEFARKFVQERRRQTGAADSVAELRQFIHLLLCSNEWIYLE